MKIACDNDHYYYNQTALHAFRSHAQLFAVDWCAVFCVLHNKRSLMLSFWESTVLRTSVFNHFNQDKKRYFTTQTLNGLAQKRTMGQAYDLPRWEELGDWYTYEVSARYNSLADPGISSVIMHYLTVSPKHIP